MAPHSRSRGSETVGRMRLIRPGSGRGCRRRPCRPRPMLEHELGERDTAIHPCAGAPGDFGWTMLGLGERGRTPEGMHALLGTLPCFVVFEVHTSGLCRTLGLQNPHPFLFWFHPGVQRPESEHTVLVYKSSQGITVSQLHHLKGFHLCSVHRFPSP